jgi:hypothetical protein
MRGANLQATKGYRDLRDRVVAQKTTNAQLVEQYHRTGQSMSDLFAHGVEGKSGIDAIIASANLAGGPMGGMIARGQSLIKTLGSAGLAGVAIVAAAAVVVLTAALAASVAVIATYALRVADAYRSERLLLEGMTKIPNWFGLAAGKAGDLQIAIDNVASSSALSRDRIAGLAQELYRSGARGANLSLGLQAVATATSAAGESYGGMIKGMVAGAAWMGQSVTRYTKWIENRFGAIARGQMLSLSTQMLKFRENVARLFQGLRIEGFLSALREVLSLFDQSTSSGKALRQMVEVLLSPLNSAFIALAPLVHRFFQGMVIAALRFMIVVNDARLALRRAFGGTDLLRGLDLQRVAIYAGMVALYAFVGVLGLVAVAATAGAIALTLMFAPLIAAVLLVAGVVAGLAYGLYGFGVMIADGIRYAIRWLENLDLSAVAAADAFITGLVSGIERGAARVWAAVKALALGIGKTLAGRLEVHSPSRLAFRVGAGFDAGAELGLQAGIPRVQRAVGRLGAAFDLARPEAPEAPKFEARGRVDAGMRLPSMPRFEYDAKPLSVLTTNVRTEGDRNTASTRSVSVTIHELHVHSQAPGAQGIGESLRDEIARVLERVAVQMGVRA